MSSYVAKLNQTEFTKFGNTSVSSFRLKEKLTSAHFFAAVQRTHVDLRLKSQTISKKYSTYFEFYN